MADHRSHMQVMLQVDPEGQPTFEVTFKQAFSSHTPRPGGRAKVIFDPADHSKIAVIEGEVYMPGLSVEKQQRSRQRSAEARAAAESGHLAEYIEQRKAEAIQAGGIVIGGPGAPAAPAAKPDVVDQLTRLADLRDRGALTEAEFQAQKAKLCAAG